MRSRVVLGTGTRVRVPGYPGTRFITRYPGTRSIPGYPNTDRVCLLPVCCPLDNAFMTANLVQSTMYLTHLMQIYMQTANMTDIH